MHIKFYDIEILFFFFWFHDSFHRIELKKKVYNLHKNLFIFIINAFLWEHEPWKSINFLFLKHSYHIRNSINIFNLSPIFYCFLLSFFCIDIWKIFLLFIWNIALYTRITFFYEQIFGVANAHATQHNGCCKKYNISSVT
jgi:hypothetical protein